MLNQLKQLNVHEALFLLRECLAIPMLTYVLKALTSFRSLILVQYDLEIQKSLGEDFNVQLTTHL